MKTRLALAMTVVLLLLGSCSLSMSGRQGENAETIRVTTCSSATTVSAHSCNANVVKLGGGN